MENRKQLSKEAIIKNAIKFETFVPHVYFIIKNGEIIYIGYSRTGTDKVKKRMDEYDADRYFIENINEMLGTNVEEIAVQYIVDFLPKYNTTLIANDLYKSKSYFKEAYGIDGTKLNKIIRGNRLSAYFYGVYYSVKEFERCTGYSPINKKVGE